MVRFSGGVNMSEAQRTTAYWLIAAGTGGSFTAKNAVKIKLRSAVYNSATDTVTLTPASPFAQTNPVQLVVFGTGPTGLQDSHGRLIDGNHDGRPGGNAVAVLKRSGVTIAARLSSAGMAGRLLSRRAFMGVPIAVRH
jgi:hypothetical protein